MITPTKEQIKSLKIGQTVYFCDACGYVIASMIYDKKRNTYFVKNHAGEKGVAKRGGINDTNKRRNTRNNSRYA